MPHSASSPLHKLKQILGWRRLLFTGVISTLAALMLSPTWLTPFTGLLRRTLLIGLSALATFGLLEHWPARLPGWLARWALQIIGIVFAVPLTVLVIYLTSTDPGQAPFWTDQHRINGFMSLSLLGLLLAPWVAVSALMRQREAVLRNQALRFELERTELERRALDGRLRLLQAQVQPHFLFNTLANVRALVNSGSPRAGTVLDSLIAYLRATVSRLHEPVTTLGQELELVRAYLELMQMRMPDRLQFAINAAGAVDELRCPPLALLTLVENAVRHGIDPSEEGGRIDVGVSLHEGHCRLRVCDTGVGPRADGATGTGLATLRERLQLLFGADVRVQLSPVAPHGACAEAEFPAQRGAS